MLAKEPNGFFRRETGNPEGSSSGNGDVRDTYTANIEENDTSSSNFQTFLSIESPDKMSCNEGYDFGDLLPLIREGFNIALDNSIIVQEPTGSEDSEDSMSLPVEASADDWILWGNGRALDLDITLPRPIPSPTERSIGSYERQSVEAMDSYSGDGETRGEVNNRMHCEIMGDTGVSIPDHSSTMNMNAEGKSEPLDEDTCLQSTSGHTAQKKEEGHHCTEVNGMVRKKY